MLKLVLFTCIRFMASSRSAACRRTREATEKGAYACIFMLICSKYVLAAFQALSSAKRNNSYRYLSAKIIYEKRNLNAKLAISYLFRQCSHSSQQVHSFSNFSHVDKFERRVTFCRRQANLDKQFTAKATTEKALKVNSLFFQKKIYYRHLLDARIATRLWNGTK
ncbi:hypothetical protein M514_05061 [Trichuris suis]|uniref:Uncharacterized protein n=1 Tax=Trichuris suis TaxID=68888 RepID=A0A085NCT5_9BILA|nr:hypothetical protein M514_05061 [Trichuris suis]